MGIIIRKNLITQDGRRVRANARNIDLRTGTAPEQEAASIEKYEFSGYHRNTIDSYLTGVAGSPYSRQFDKNTGKLVACGIDIYDRLIQRHELLLRSTGEPIVLLRRMTTGELCPCYDKVRHKASGRCPTCFGTNFVGGYVRFIEEGEPDGRIFIRLSPNEEDLLSEETGLWQDNEPQCWTLPSPILRDRDVVIRFDPDTGEETWRYEVQKVTRNQGFFNRHTAQLFTMKRLDKTHPISFVRTVDLQNNLVGDLQGRGDELSDAIEAEFGDSFNDGGFSQGYFAGYDHGYADGFYGKDYRGIPDNNRDGVVDIPFGPDDNIKDNVSNPNISLTGHVGVSDPNTRVGDHGQSEGMEFYLSGYQEGYSDGFEDGERKRKETTPTERFTWEVRRGDVPSETAGDPNPRGQFYQR